MTISHTVLVSDLFDAYAILSYLYSWTCVFLYDTDLSPTDYRKKVDGTVDVTPERCALKTMFHVFKQTRLLLCTMVMLAQDKQGHTVSSETGALSCTETNHSMVREIVNAVGNVRTLDSVLLEVSKSTDTILRQYQVRKVIKTGDTTDANALPSGNDLSGENSTDSSMWNWNTSRQRRG